MAWRRAFLGVDPPLMPAPACRPRLQQPVVEGSTTTSPVTRGGAPRPRDPPAPWKEEPDAARLVEEEPATAPSRRSLALLLEDLLPVDSACRRPPRPRLQQPVVEEMAKKCYVVYIGWVPGVYEDWKDCQKQVNNFSGNSYQRYESREVAKEKWRRHGRKKWRNFLVITTLLLFIIGYVFYFI